MNQRISKIQRHLLPSIIDILLIALFISILKYSTICSYDIWWHLKTGLTLLSGVFPKVDIFSFTATGREWILHEWGSEIVFALIDKYWSLAGLMVFKAIIVVSTIGIVYKSIQKRSVNFFLSLLIMLLVIIGSANLWVVRPHIFSMLFLVILADRVYDYWDNGNKSILYYLPFLFLVWINLHGGFVLGFVFLGVCIAAQSINNFFKFDTSYEVSQSKVNNLFISSVVSFFACFINPNTYKSILYPFSYLGNNIPSHLVQEWQSVTFKDNPDFMIVIFFVIVSLCFSKKRPRFFEAALIILFIFWSLKSQRLTGYFSVLCIPLMGESLQSLIQDYYSKLISATKGRAGNLLNKIGNYISTRSVEFIGLDKQLNKHSILIASIIIFSIITVTDYFPSFIKVIKNESSYPVATLEYLKTHEIKGNILNKFRWGGLLIYEFPEKKVFIDGRLDVYQKDILDEYLTVVDLKDDWEKIISKYNITHVLLDKDAVFSSLITRIDSDWKPVVEDENSILFIYCPSKEML
jgi:hypothetical protein